MTALKSLLENGKRLSTVLRVTSPEPIQLRAQVAKMAGKEGVVAVDDLPALQQRVAGLFQQGRLESLTRRELRQTCAAFYYPPMPSGRDPRLARAILELVARERRKMLLVFLVNAYLDAFKANDPDISLLGGWLTTAINDWPANLTGAWSEHQRMFSLFDVTQAPRRLASAVLSQALTSREVLVGAGLDTEHRLVGGLASESFRFACRTISSGSVDHAIASYARLSEWAVGNVRETATDRALLYPDAWLDFVEASLNPWAATEPPLAMKTLILSTLFQMGGGDPRIANTNRWAAAKQQAPVAMAVLIRWLTKASVIQFLEIVHRSLPDDEARRMWSYRKSFWLSYLKDGGPGPQIEAAWVAFGSDAADLARKTARQTGDRSFETFGRQNVRLDQHSALIMKIDGKIVVEWSHNSKCQFWPAGDKSAPQLFQSQYNGQIYSAPKQEIHSSPQTYTWQRKFAEIIEGKAVYSPRPSWRPNRV